MKVLVVVLMVFCSQVCSALDPVTGIYGDTVFLPCDGSSYRHIPEERKIIHWETADRHVVDFYRGRIQTYNGFENRAELSRERIRHGDFSLILHNVKFSDEDTYECRTVDENGYRKFLGDVKLTSVIARSEVLTLLSGDNLTLPLHTAERVEVLFNPGGSAQSPRVFLSSAGLPGHGYEQRVSVQYSTLTLRSLTPADQGSYTVRDLRGNIISTVIVTVGDATTMSWPAIVGITVAVLVVLMCCIGCVKRCCED
ncbi:T-cell surface glycoprotein CD4-like [Lepisosteus oculatus]|uniref:T-cell surface glycoprotein CD4-like n=1 Tax=Lepisosteus oculatus TaxID=7918 RepID=UPI0035F507D7